MVFAVYLYVIVATVFALKIGRPLIRLNYVSEQLNATFRYALIRLREYGESIAFYHGEAVERANLLARFGLIIANMWALVFRSLKFLGFNLVVSQAAVVFPFLVQAPRLLSKQITLGDVMQTAQSFGQVEGALSYLRSSYDQFAAYRAVVNRLASFLDAIAAATQLPRVQLEAVEQGLAVHALTVRTPTHAALVHDLNLALPRGASLLVRGCSGIGKTTLLRALPACGPMRTVRCGGRLRRKRCSFRRNRICHRARCAWRCTTRLSCKWMTARQWCCANAISRIWSRAWMKRMTGRGYCHWANCSAWR